MLNINTNRTLPALYVSGLAKHNGGRKITASFFRKRVSLGRKECYLTVVESDPAIGACWATIGWDRDFQKKVFNGYAEVRVPDTRGGFAGYRVYHCKLKTKLLAKAPTTDPVKLLGWILALPLERRNFEAVKSQKQAYKKYSHEHPEDDSDKTPVDTFSAERIAAKLAELPALLSKEYRGVTVSDMLGLDRDWEGTSLLARNNYGTCGKGEA